MTLSLDGMDGLVTLHHPRLCFFSDPAAESFSYPVSLDVRDLVTLEDVMEEMELGPNGGLLYCMEYLEENLHEWLGDHLQASCGLNV